MRALVFGMFRDEEAARGAVDDLQVQHPRARMVNVEEQRPSWRPDALPLSRLELLRAALLGAFVCALGATALGALLVAARMHARPTLDQMLLAAALGALFGLVVGPLTASAQRRDVFRRLHRRHGGPFVVVVDAHTREIVPLLRRLRGRGATPAEVA